MAVAPRSIECMGQKIWTATELAGMTPSEQDAIFDASIVRDLDRVPAPILQRVRSRLEHRAARVESPNAP